MIRVLAKLWNRRYVVLACVAAFILILCLLPKDKDAELGTSSPVEDALNEPSMVTMYTSQEIVLYAKPNLKAKQVSTLAEGTQVTNVQPSKDGWCSIDYEDDTVYVQGDFLVDEYIIETEPVETEPPTEPPFEPYWTDDGKWLIVEERVKAEGNVWLRDKPGGEKLLLLENHDEVFRSQIGVNGWSKVTVNDGTEGYVSTFYLMPVEKVTYEEVEEYVIVTEDARVRASGSITSEQQGWAIKGDKYVRVGISQHGWSQILYKGHVYYIFSNYVSAISDPVDAEDLGSYIPPSQKNPG